MRKPSNQMPQYEVPKMKWYFVVIAWIFLILYLGSIAYKAYDDIAFRYVILMFIVLILVLSGVGVEKYKKSKRSRKEWNIGKFAKEFNLKEVDTWVVRAVYEAVYDEVEIPIKADDDIDKDLGIDMGDLGFDEILINVSQRTGRVLTENSVGHDDIKNIITVRDLVEFFNKLPRKK